MIKKSLILSLALIVPLLFFMGCAEDEEAVAPTKDLSIILLAGPQGEVPFNAYVTYKWQAKGGSGNYTGYDYSLQRGGVDVGSGNDVLFNTVTFRDLAPGDYTFSVSVTDTDNKTAQESRDMTVVNSTAAPVVSITKSPLAGGEVTEYSTATFTWSGDDPDAFFGVVVGYTFTLMLDDTNLVGTAMPAPLPITSITYDSLLSGAYKFTVTAYNNAGVTAMDSVAFSVIPANILWIDDFYQGDIPGEFAERLEKVNLFDGFAWMEFDMNDNYTGHFSTLEPIDDIINAPGATIETVIWDGEGHTIGSELYIHTGYGETVLSDFIDNGGNVIFIGSDINDQAWENYPPLPGDFDNLYMGIATETIDRITADTTDTTIWDEDLGIWVDAFIITYDTTTYGPWDNSEYYQPGTPPDPEDNTLTGVGGYPDVGIDIGRDPGTHQGSYAYFNISPDAVEITHSVLDDAPAGYIYDVPGPAGVVVVLGYNPYYAAPAVFKEIMQKLLSEELGM